MNTGKQYKCCALWFFLDIQLSQLRLRSSITIYLRLYVSFLFISSFHCTFSLYILLNLRHQNPLKSKSKLHSYRGHLEKWIFRIGSLSPWTRKASQLVAVIGWWQSLRNRSRFKIKYLDGLQTEEKKAYTTYLRESIRNPVPLRHSIWRSGVNSNISAIYRPAFWWE